MGSGGGEEERGAARRGHAGHLEGWAVVRGASQSRGALECTEVVGDVGATISAMAPTTVNVEIDRSLLERLRERRPAKSDRELLENAARIQLGREASDRARERFAGVSSEEIEREAVKAAREVRRERASARRASG